MVESNLFPGHISFSVGTLLERRLRSSGVCILQLKDERCLPPRHLGLKSAFVEWLAERVHAATSAADSNETGAGLLNHQIDIERRIG